jgi:DNA-binding NarL/FixJ family response regulator
LAALLSELDGLSVIGRTSNGDDLASEIELYQPDIVVLDVSESTERMSSLVDLDTPVLAIVPSDDAAALAWAQGARGILPRSIGRDELGAALRAMAEGLVAIDGRLRGAIASSSGSSSTPLVEPPSPRELQVLQLVAAGMTNKSIASELGISEHTVKFHVNALLGKLGARSRTEAVTIATRLGLIRL